MLLRALGRLPSISVVGCTIASGHELRKVAGRRGEVRIPFEGTTGFALPKSLVSRSTSCATAEASTEAARAERAGGKCSVRDPAAAGPNAAVHARYPISSIAILRITIHPSWGRWTAAPAAGQDASHGPPCHPTGVPDATARLLPGAQRHVSAADAWKNLPTRPPVAGQRKGRPKPARHAPRSVPGAVRHDVLRCPMECDRGERDTCGTGARVALDARLWRRAARAAPGRLWTLRRSTGMRRA